MMKSLLCGALLFLSCLTGCSPLVGIYLIQSAEKAETEPTPSPSAVLEELR